MTSQPTTSSNSPRFRGLFIGVNRYQSPAVPHLASAVRDATVLQALFADNLGENGVLLTDSQATRGALVSELSTLAASSSPDDVVVIAFSGHGSNTHELVTYDADPSNLPTTALLLGELTDLVSAIPARQLVVVLDCCFSGGAGAKVLHAPLIPRTLGADSTEVLLERLAGTGRLILTASTADQPAWEDPRVGHGLLTYHLLQALLGDQEVVENGRLPLYNLLSYVTRRVIASASGTAAARQEPTLRGQMDGVVSWPIFRPGDRYRALVPTATPGPVSADIRSLRSHGLSESILDAWAAHVPSLNPLQQAAVNEAGLLSGSNVLVTAPTSSGKTMVGELAALRAAQNGGRSVFLLPTKALVNEQYDRFVRIYGPSGIRTVRATGEIGDQVPALLRGQFDLAVLTYEKFSGLALGNPHLLRLLAVVVVDEVQIIVDLSRGPNLEFLLTLLKARRQDGVGPQVVALSAVLGDLGGLDSWLDATLLRRHERPVPLAEGVLGPSGLYRHLTPDGEERHDQLVPSQYGAGRARDLLLPLVRYLVEEGQQVIVFRNMRGNARGAAAYLANSLGLPRAALALDALPGGDPSGVSAGLRQCLEGGVAFHISDLDRDEKRVVEDHFRAPDSQIRVLVATTTLAQGVNLPAETVVIAELEHPAGQGTTTPYTVAEYKNIAGRAGRLGLTAQGRSIILGFGGLDEERKWQRYVTGTPEDLRSRLLDQGADLFTLVLRVIAVTAARAEGAALTSNDVIGVLANSFAAHQRRLAGVDNPFQPAQIAAVLNELRSQNFVEENPDGGLTLTTLGALVAQSGISVRSAVRVASALRAVPATSINRATLIVAAQLTSEVDQVTFPVNGKGWQKETQTFVGELRRQSAAAAILNALGTGATERTTVPRRAKKAVACLLWMGGVPADQLEAALMRHHRERDAIGPTRAVASRTQDVIGTVIDIAREIHPDADLEGLARLLPAQLELGIPREIVLLATHAAGGLARHDYLRLADQGLSEPNKVAEADDDVLLKALNGDRQKLRLLRQAAIQAIEADEGPGLEELLPAPED